MEDQLKELAKEISILNERLESMETFIESQTDPQYYPTFGSVIRELITSINELKTTIEEKL